MVPHGTDRLGNPCTLTVLSAYNFQKLIAAKLGTMWLELVQYCDVYFDLRIHEYGNRHVYVRFAMRVFT